MRIHYVAYLVVFFLISCAPPSYGQTFHVLEGASGSADGSDWANAFTSLPATLTRGATYYIGDGSYSAYTFDDAESGATIITVKKATASDHGSSTGWSSTFGDGQAQFPAMTISRGYYVIDGQVGSGATYSSYGFLVTPSVCAQNNTGINLPTVNSSTAMHQITVSHVAVVMCGPSFVYTAIGVDVRTTVAVGSPLSTSITVSHNYIGGGYVGIRLINVQGVVFEHNYVDANWSDASFHGGQIIANSAGQTTDDVTVRYNTFKNSCVYVIDWHRDVNTNWKVYGNVVDGHQQADVCEGVDGITSIFSTGDSAYDDVLTGGQFHNNTITNIKCVSNHSVVNPGDQTDPATTHSFAYNNLIDSAINCTFDDAVTGTWVIHDYNAFFNHSSTIGSGGDAAVETNGQIGVSSILGGNYRLLSPTNAGTTLLSPYNIDAVGNIRGASGVWDRGAYDYYINELVSGEMDL